MTLLGAALIGIAIGFLGGLLGKGGSAIATPLLHIIGVPAIVAVAAPLPATIPSTMVAGLAYWHERLIDWRVVRWAIGVGIPATIAGAVATRWIDGSVLVGITDVILIGLGIRLLLPHRGAPGEDGTSAGLSAWRIGLVAAAVGVTAGLLANSGGFLLAPLFITVLHLPIKSALASSLAVASVLAVPGTVVHAALGHLDWTLVAVFAVTAVPLSYLGAKTAIRIDAARLERGYGVVLIVLGAVFLAVR